jgi:hypothetical protein
MGCLVCVPQLLVTIWGLGVYSQPHLVADPRLHPQKRGAWARKSSLVPASLDLIREGYSGVQWSGWMKFLLTIKRIVLIIVFDRR